MRSRDGKEVTTGTPALAVEKDFYSVKGPEGELFTEAEDALAVYDGKASAIHAAMLAGNFPLQEDDRIEFGLWIGLQQLRGRASRQSGEEMHDQVLKLIVKFGLEQSLHPEDGDLPPLPKPPPGAGPGVRIPNLSGLPDDVKEVLGDPSRYQFAPSRPQQLIFMLEGVPKLAEPYLAAEWHLLRFERPLLFTSDEPIILFREPGPESDLRGIGPASADAIYLPLSPRHCLAMIHKQPSGSESIHDVADREAGPINRHSVGTFWSQLFRYPDGSPFPPFVPPLPERRVVVG